jgi:hypothetical protein
MDPLSSKTRVCLVMTHRQQLRSWVYNGTFRELDKKFDMNILLSEDLKEFQTDKEFQGRIVQIWRFPPNIAMERMGLFLQLVKHRKHKTFRERIRKQILDEEIFQKRIQKVLYILRSSHRKTLLFAIHLKPIYWYYKLKYQNNLDSNLIRNLPNAEIYLVITSISDYSTDILLNSLRANQKFIVQVVENWDNLSSKLSIDFNPNKLIVWSQQTKDHAVNIHGFDSQSIEILGSPRFPSSVKASELKKFKSKEKNSLTFFYAGFNSVCNNLKSVIDIYHELENTFADQEIKLIYRPHPIRLKAISLEYEVLKPKNIFLDLFPDAGVTESVWPTYYDGFYDSMLRSDVIIGTPSTFLMEEIMFGKPIILDYRACAEHYNSSRRYFQHSTHFEEIVSCDLIPKMYKTSEISDLALKALSKNGVDCESLRNYLIYSDEDEYSERVVNLLTELKNT